MNITKVPSPPKYITRTEVNAALKDTALRLIKVGYPKAIETRMISLFREGKYQEVQELALTVDVYKRAKYHEVREPEPESPLPIEGVAQEEGQKRKTND